MLKEENEIFSPFQGREFTDTEILDVLLDYSSWINFKRVDNTTELIDLATNDLMNQQIIGWFQSKSEIGQRALGSRSILADPRNITNRQIINSLIKEREWYRPLAPSILDEHVSEWFDNLSSNNNISPYMSITGYIKPVKQSIIPAVCHIDGSARLQTVTSSLNSLYYRLIQLFNKKTNIPLILNTSLNRKNQPIVETPLQAIKTLLAMKGTLNKLYMNSWIIEKREFLNRKNENTNEITMNETNDIIINANPIYLYEVTNSMNNMNEPIKVRIQNGNENDWIVLNSKLHLDVLQLLQPQSTNHYDGNDNAIDNDKYVSPENELLSQDNNNITINELYDILLSTIDNDSDDNNDNSNDSISWKNYIEVIKELYDDCLISITNNNNDSNSEEREYNNNVGDSFDPLFSYFSKDQKIVDLRE